MRRLTRIAAPCAALTLLALVACGDAGRAPDPAPTPGAAPPADATPRARARPTPPGVCAARRGRVVGRVADPALDELSGLTRAGGVLWAIEDSGAAPAVTALRPGGAVLGTTAVTGAAATDWEDVAAAGGDLFLADIGDNAPDRPSVQVYRVPRPAPGAAATAPAERLDLVYPDGPRDAEAVVADPVRGQLVVLTKAPTGGHSYVAPLRAPAGSYRLRAGPRVPEALVTAASLSEDGRVLAVRNYSSIAAWRRRGDESLLRTVARPPCRAPADLLGEGQGEALALDHRGGSALTVAEEPGARIRRYRGR